jgi:hypothetical protein
MVAYEYFDTQKQMWFVLKKEIKEKLIWEIQEIEKLEKAEATENRLKAIISRKKRVEDFYVLIELFEDILKVNEKMLIESKKEIEFMKSVVTVCNAENDIWMSNYRKLLNDRIKN